MERRIVLYSARQVSVLLETRKDPEEAYKFLFVFLQNVRAILRKCNSKVDNAACFIISWVCQWIEELCHLQSCTFQITTQSKLTKWNFFKSSFSQWYILQLSLYSVIFQTNIYVSLLKYQNWQQFKDCQFLPPVPLFFFNYRYFVDTYCIL